MKMRTLRAIAFASLIAASVCSPVGAESLETAANSQETNMAATNKSIVEIALNGWMSGDGKALQSLLSDDIEWTITGHSAAAGTTKGKAELMQKVLGPFGARFSAANDPFRPRKINGIFADGDTVIAHFEGSGTSNDGARYDNDYVWLLTMQEGKAVQGTAFFDSIAFDQLWRVDPAK